MSWHTIKLILARHSSAYFWAGIWHSFCSAYSGNMLQVYRPRAVWAMALATPLWPAGSLGPFRDCWNCSSAATVACHITFHQQHAWQGSLLCHRHGSWLEISMLCFMDNYCPLVPSSPRRCSCQRPMHGCWKEACRARPAFRFQSASISSSTGTVLLAARRASEVRAAKVVDDTVHAKRLQDRGCGCSVRCRRSGVPHELSYSVPGVALS